MLLILGLGATLWHNNDAFAKNQAANTQKKSAAELMAKYSAKGKQKSSETIRRSRLPQMNIVSESSECSQRFANHNYG